METFAGAALVCGENLCFGSFIFRFGELVSFFFRVILGASGFIVGADDRPHSVCVASTGRWCVALFLSAESSFVVAPFA